MSDSAVPIVVWGAVLVVLLGGCANPVPPSGGPRDATPPSVLETQPARDTVNVSTDTETLLIQFSEYLERTSLVRSLSVTPAFEGRPTFNWSGRAVEIVFPESLRDSTTYLFTIDTELSDAHGVSLEEPITVAFSTGPQINRGQIEGHIAGGRRGQPQEQVDVYAYAIPEAGAGPPQPLPPSPSYRTQSGSDGTFEFNYMREQPYYVLALRDNNRNREPDPLEPFAVPPQAAIPADSGASQVPVPWLLTRADTVAPELQRVQALSRERLQASFNEPVRFGTREPEAWAPQDTAAGTTLAVRSVYAHPSRADAVLVRTAPMEEVPYRLRLERGVVTDTLGRGLPPDTAYFEGAERADTTRTRFRGFIPRSHSPDSTGAYPLLAGGQLGVRFNQAPDRSTLRQALAVEDTTGQPRGFTLDTEDGIAYSIQLDPPLEVREFVDLRVDGRALAGPDTTYRRRVRRVTARSLGGVEGRVVLVDTSLHRPRPAEDTMALSLPSLFPDSLGKAFLPDSLGNRTGGTPQRTEREEGDVDGSIVVVLTATDATVPFEPRRHSTAPGSTFVFEELPEGTYQFRAFLDRNENEQWDGGRLQPYQSAEPVTWTDQPVETRPRWTTELATPLRLLRLVPAAEASEAPSGPTGDPPDEDS